MTSSAFCAPFFDSRRMIRSIKEQGYSLGRKRVYRLMGKMGIAAIYPTPRVQQASPGDQGLS
ncbi:IS3 family transposase [Dethiosulfatarculus sandiegensis]